MNTFAELPDQVDNLSLDEKETFMEILQKRINEFKRLKLINDIESAEKEYSEGRCKPATPEEIMKEILA
jgi:hypothetical protein